MSGVCDRFADRLADDGLAIALSVPELAAHYDGCADCRALAASLAELDRDLSSLPSREADGGLIARTLARVRTTPATVAAEPAVAPRFRVPAWVRAPLGRVAAGLVLLVGVAFLASLVIPNLTNSIQRGRQRRSVSGVRPEAGVAMHPVEPEVSAMPPSQPESKEERVSADGSMAVDVVDEVANIDSRSASASVSYYDGPPAAPPVAAKADDYVEGDRVAASEKQIAGGKDAGSYRQLLRGVGAEQVAQQQALRVQNDAVSLYSNQVQNAGERAKLKKRAIDVAARRDRDDSGVDARKNEAIDVPASAFVFGRAAAPSDDRLVALGAVGDRTTIASDAPAGDSAVEGPIEARPITPDLEFQEASGYWANTYVPGDPTIRLLETRLRGEPSPISGPDGRVLRLDSASRQYLQPFDVPENAALAAYLHADRRGISGPTRLLVQVGLQGTLRASGLRPAMNVGVVLDLTGGVSAEVSAGMRALLTALLAAKQTGDRISLTVAGVPGAGIVAADDFKHGTLAVVTRQLFGDEPMVAAPVLDLAGAVASATLAVSRADDPNAQLGASLVLLITGNAIAEPELTAVEDQAHRGAVGGIPLSVVGVGGGVDLAAIDRLTLAGQGNRRLLGGANEAASVIDRELHSASRVVARAVRLRIRLAPGVRLVEVIGSSKLDDGRAERVREAEVSVDRRLAKNFGIEADRGEDEEGIQMVIPAYYAGDAHVVLLDVVVDRPGAIADVTVRYKDLVFLRNGVAQTNLSLTSRRDEPGPLERNVVKNLMATRLSEAILRAGESLEQGAVGEADALLVEQLQKLDHARRLQGWENDSEIHNDIAMIGEYRSALQRNSAEAERQRVADSLRYAGYLKVQARRK